MKRMAMGQQIEIVLVGFAEADARVEADAARIDTGGHQGVATRLQIGQNFPHHVAIDRVVLHRCRRALHVHGTHAGAALGGERQHGRVCGEPGHVVDDFSTSIDRRAGDRPFRSIDRDRHRQSHGQALDDRHHAA